MIPNFLQDTIDPDYWEMLSQASITGDYSALENRLHEFIALDPLMLPFAGEEGTKYYKPFVQTVVPKILPVLINALRTGIPPEIALSYDEIDEKRRRLGIGSFGSPQDVLYGFTSERYPNWGNTLTGMGFQAACMSEPKCAVLTMAPRYLSLGPPDVEVTELPGTISIEFHETNQAVFGKLHFLRRYRQLCTLVRQQDLTLTGRNRDTLDQILRQLEGLQGDFPESVEINRQILVREINQFTTSNPTPNKIRVFLTGDRQHNVNVSQEQLVLKYVTEGNYLQKLLEGHRVEHVQSNVKMVRNILRDNKCEVDALYRVVGQKRILLLEAKGKNTISRAQLYSVYETFRSRLPIDWGLDIVAAMLTDPSAEQRRNNTHKCIDLVKIAPSPHLSETFTERLLQVTPQRHYRWLIR